MNTKSVGELSEACVLVRCLQLGYICSKPYGDNARYDLVIDDGNSLQRIQIKTGRIRRGCVLFNTVNHNRVGNTKNYASKSYKNHIDAFVVFVPETQKFYKIPVDEAGESEKKLRIEPPLNKQISGICWAANYEF